MASNVEDLEDGEIEDSEASDVELKPQHTYVSAVPQFEGSTFRKQPAISISSGYRASHVLDSSGESSNDDDDLSDESPQKAKVKRMNKPDTTAAHESSDAAHGNMFLRAAEQFQKSRSAIWEKVAIEQTMNDTLRRVNTVEAEDKVDRGVETYDFTRKDKHNVQESRNNHNRETIDYSCDFLDDNLYNEDPPQQHSKQPEQDKMLSDKECFGSVTDKRQNIKDRLGKLTKDKSVDMADDIVDSDSETEKANIYDIESFGMAARSKPVSRKRSIRDRLGKRSDKEQFRDTSGMDAGDASQKQQSVRDRLGVPVSNTPVYFHSRPAFNLEAKEDDPPEKVAEELIMALGEPETQTELFFRAVTTIGVKKSLELYFMTENVEANGGMLVVRGNRRRTPGGVYLQLLKSDGEVTKEHVKKIFLIPEIEQKRQRHRRNRRQREKVAVDAMEEEPLLPSKAEVLLQRDFTKDETVTMETEAKIETLNDDDIFSLDDGLEDNCVHIEFPDPM